MSLLATTSLLALSGCSSSENSASDVEVKLVAEESLSTEVMVEIDEATESLVAQESDEENVIADNLADSKESVSQEIEYAGEEFYPSEPEFSPQVQEAINVMNGVAK